MAVVEEWEPATPLPADGELAVDARFVDERY
jgi:hypothetical protein